MIKGHSYPSAENTHALVWIKGAGDLASGIALRLVHSGFQVFMTDLPEPTSVRRTVCFSEAIRLRSCQVEDLTGIRADSIEAVWEILKQGSSEMLRNSSGTQSNTAEVQDNPSESSCEKFPCIPVIADPSGRIAAQLCPDVIVDAIIAKKNLGTAITDAPIVIGVGPGFTAGLDCHAVIETKRGHTLGRVILEGSAIPNTGIPGNIGGYASERVFRASADGIFHPARDFGDIVNAGDEIAWVECVSSSGSKGPVESEIISSGSRVSVESKFPSSGRRVPVKSEIDGIIRGMLPDGLQVTKGMKAGDIDPRGASVDYRTVSDKALAIGGGVLEAILRFSN